MEDETGSLTTDALEIKLKQFDECLDQDRAKEQQAKQAATAAAQAGASGSNTSGSNGQQAQTGEAGSDSTPGQSVAAQDEVIGEDTGNESQNNEGKTPGSLPQLAEIPSARTTGSSAPGTTDTIPQGVDNRLVEDDVAKLLREAAEKETDPKLKKELWDQYNAYMQSL